MAAREYREKLIDEVKKYPVLYDTGHENHRDIDIRDRCWEEIAGRLGGNCEVVKREWKILRDCLRQSLRTTRTTKAGTPCKRWRFQSRMAYVLPHMTQRKSRRLPRDDIKLDELEQTEVEETPPWEPRAAGGGGGDESDALDLFFASVCQSTRRLPRDLQNNIKRKVLEVLLQAEEEFYSDENKMADFKGC